MSDTTDSLQQGSTHGIGKVMLSANQLRLTGFASNEILKHGGSPTKSILIHFPCNEVFIQNHQFQKSSTALSENRVSISTQQECANTRKTHMQQ